jgi:methionine-rich copper-binding protein CopC
MRLQPTVSKLSLFAALWVSACANAPAGPMDPVDPGSPPRLSLVMTAPGDGATGVGLSPSLALEFTAPISQASVSVTISPNASLGAPALSAEGASLSFADVVLSPNTTYSVSVSATGALGQPLEGPTSFTFTTRGADDTARPTLVSSLPQSGAVSVPADQVLSLTFSEPMDAAGLVVTIEPEVDLGAAAWSMNDTVVSFSSPLEPLADGQRYSVTIAGADKAGNALQAAAAVTFTVATQADSTRPTVVATTPAQAATGVSLSTAVSVTFSEAMDQASVNAAVSISPSASGIVTWDQSGTLRTLQAKGLSANTQYTLTVGVGAKDLAGNALAAPHVVTFTTGAAPDVLAPTATSSLPAATELGVARNANIRVTFSEPMDKQATQAAFFITAPAGFGAGTFSWSVDGTTMTFNPSGTFAYGAQVSWRVTNAATDLAGNALAAQMARSFTVIKQGTVVLESVAASDGYIRTLAPEVWPTNTTLHVGEILDELAGETGEVRSFLTFNLSALPATTERILFASLYLSQMQLRGDPVAKLGGPAKLERVNYGETLALSDFNVARYTSFNDSVDFAIGAVDGWRSNGQMALGVFADWQNRVPRGNLTQFRLRFPNASSGALEKNYVSFHSAETFDSDCPRPNPAAAGSSCRPHLVLTYEYR